MGKSEERSSECRPVTAFSGHRIVEPQEGENFYRVDSRSYIRVSTVLSQLSRPYLEAWRLRIGQDESSRITMETAIFGQRVHEVLRIYDMGADFDLMIKGNPVLLPFWAAWQDWTSRYVKEWLAIEEVVWSEKLGVAGKVDRVAILIGDRAATVLDIKTGAITPGMAIQLAAYMLFWNEKEKGCRRAVRRIIISIPRADPGSLHVKEFTNSRDLDHFRDLVKLYRGLNAGIVADKRME